MSVIRGGAKVGGGGLGVRLVGGAGREPDGPGSGEEGLGSPYGVGGCITLGWVGGWLLVPTHPGCETGEYGKVMPGPELMMLALLA